MPGGAFVTPPKGRARFTADREVAGTLLAREGRAQAAQTRSWPDYAGGRAGARGGSNRGTFYTPLLVPKDQTRNGMKDHVFLPLVLSTRETGPEAERGLPLSGKGVRTRPVVRGPAAGDEFEAPAPRNWEFLAARSARPGNIRSDIF
ncbi:hypothetical protein MCOR24_011611 [Pyricularia oryzae]|nr:hypothetical protein MCOR24_011611 [Pyricularia oryzae]